MSNPAVVGVRFGPSGRVAFFRAAGFDDLEIGDRVVVPTESGPAVARVVIAPRQILSLELPSPRDGVSRRAPEYETPEISQRDEWRSRLAPQEQV